MDGMVKKIDKGTVGTKSYSYFFSGEGIFFRLSFLQDIKFVITIDDFLFWRETDFTKRHDTAQLTSINEFITTRQILRLLCYIHKQG